jgi:hypothetical protein
MTATSLDHFIRPRHHRRRDRQPNLLRRLQIDDELELRRLLDRQIGGLGPFKILSTNVAARRSISVLLAP